MKIDKKNILVTRRINPDFGYVDFTASYTLTVNHKVTQEFIMSTGDDFARQLTEQSLYKELDNSINGEARRFIRELYSIASEINRNQRTICEEDEDDIRRKEAELSEIADLASEKGLW